MELFQSGKRLPAIPIIYEDNHLLLVEKPAGLLAQADRWGNPDLLSLLKRYLKEKYAKPGEAWLGLVHRLDQPVGGMMVFAKTSKAAARLSEQIRRHEWRKGYLAVVHGLVEPIQGTWCDEISSQKSHGRYTVVKKQNTESGNRKARTCELSYQVLAYRSQEKISLLEIDLTTGRSHQIRVQTSSRKFPLLGDRRYGKATELDRGLPSPALYAHSLSFQHPIRGERMSFVQKPDRIPFNLFEPYEIRMS